MANKKEEKTNLIAIIVPSIVTAIVGVIAAFLSYQAGLNQITIPLHATQTAEARQLLFTETQTSSATINLQDVVPIAIDSAEAAQPTGVFVAKGDIVSISAVRGTWTVERELFPDDLRNKLSPDVQENIAPETWMNWWDETDASGSDYLCSATDNCPILNYRLGALIARIGKIYYTIGNNCSFVATETGQVFLQINENEDKLLDNFGILAIDIAKGSNDPSTISTNCGVPYP
jgi:hypothetical protein